MSNIIISLEALSICMLLILLYGMAFEIRRKSKLNSAFIRCIVVTLLALAADMTIWICNGREELTALLWALSFLTFSMGYLLSVMILHYITLYISERTAVSHKHLYVMWAAFLIAEAALVVCSVNKGFFYIQNGHYVTGNLYIYSQIHTAFAMIYTVVLIFCYVKVLGFHDTMAVLSYIILPVISILLHLVMPQFSLSFVASAISGLFIYITLQAKHERDVSLALQDTKVKLSIGQMQPHFLYNGLAAIREIILEDPEQAHDLIYDFATHLRACIRSISNDDLIPFLQEIRNVKAYTKIEEVRFGDALEVEYDLHVTDFDIIPLGIQPLVENAIKHGVRENEAGNGRVSVCSERIKDKNVIYVIDNGVGFDARAVLEEARSGKRDSTGLVNVIYRLEHIMGAQVTIDSRPGEGTTVRVELPIK